MNFHAAFFLIKICLMRAADYSNEKLNMIGLTVWQYYYLFIHRWQNKSYIVLDKKKLIEVN